jgi:hypothetical protein
MPDSDARKILQTLTAQGVISKDITIDKLISASQEIGSLAGEKGDWTFISPHYVYKGGAIDKIESHVNVMRVLGSNGILNKAATLEQVVAASQQITGVSAAARAGEWTFISPNFVYKGGNIALDGKVINPAVRT